MTNKEFSKYYGQTHEKRFNRTLNFMKDVVSKSDNILDLGPANPFSEMMIANGYQVQNTPAGLDLDLDYEIVKKAEYNVMTAFEFFEHLVSPFPLLRASRANKLVASVPVRLWFSKAYWNENDPYDRHFHEFEPRQFDMLLQKSGWEIKKSEKWTSYTSQIGIRPMLRRFTDRYYIVYCERIDL